MSVNFDRHKDKRISEIHERVRNSRIKKKEKVMFFSQRVDKAWKNINEIKPN